MYTIIKALYLHIILQIYIQPSTVVHNGYNRYLLYIDYAFIIFDPTHTIDIQIHYVLIQLKRDSTHYCFVALFVTHFPFVCI